MTRIVEIDSCFECPYYELDGDSPEKWGKQWCLKLMIELKTGKGIPDECPLPVSNPESLKQQ